MGIASVGKTRFRRALGCKSVTPKCLIGYVGESALFLKRTTSEVSCKVMNTTSDFHSKTITIILHSVNTVVYK